MPAGGNSTRRLTRQRKDVFLARLREHGIFERAAREATPVFKNPSGPSTTFRQAMQRDPVFAQEVEAALAEATAKVEAELHRRAVEGWEEPVYQRGELVGTIRKFSDPLLLARMKALDPRYRDKPDVNVTNVTGIRLNGQSVPADALVLRAEDLLLLPTGKREVLLNLLQELADARNEPALPAGQPLPALPPPRE